MIPTRLLPISVTWQQPGETVDGYNNPVDDWSDDARTDTTIDVYLEQQSTSEQLDGRDTTVTRLRLFANELGIQAGHRILRDGLLYTVDGDCAVFNTPAGPHHLECGLKRVTG